MNGFLWAFVLSFSISAQAALSKQECGSSDLSDQLGPVRSQGNENACFAFVAADLISFNQGFKGKDTISARDVLSNYYAVSPDKLKSWAKDQDLANGDNMASLAAFGLAHDQARELGKPVWDKVQDGGSPEAAILAYNLAGGGCSENVLPSEEKIVAKDSSYYLKNQYMKDSGFYNYKSRFHYFLPDQDCALRSKPPFQSALSFAEKLNEQNFRVNRAYENKICGVRTSLKPMRMGSISVNRQSNSNAAETVARLLSEKHLPLGIGYDPSFLLEGRAAPQKASEHISSIVGTRWNNGQCQFKLRNTWGASCSSPKYAEEFNGTNCDDGNIWINESDLNSRVSELFAITPQNP